jgi:hypothetical protein
MTSTRESLGSTGPAVGSTAGGGSSALDRRAFLRLAAAGACLGGGVLAVASAARAHGTERQRDVVEGLDTFERLLARAQRETWRARPIGERTGTVGMALRQTPYVDATLELYEDREVCSVDFRGLDCVTFYESSLGFARMLRRDGRTPEALLAEVTFTRYRGGRLTDYASRLHYLSDWIADNEAKRVVRVLTPELPGAVRFTKHVNFMTTHPQAYRQLRSNSDLVQKIARVEDEINARETLYLPKAAVAAAQRHLRTGDIIGVTTTLDGLDCAHAGLAYRDERGMLRFLHASTARKAVVLDEALATYLTGVATHTGIMVARPLEV